MRQFIYILAFTLFYSALDAQPCYLVKNIHTGEQATEISFLGESARAGNFLYFVGAKCSESPELYAVDLQTDSTFLPRNVWGDRSPWGDNRWCGTDPIFYFQRPEQLTPVGNQLYYVTPHLDFGKEIWHTDATYAGTGVCGDIMAGVMSSNPTQLTAFKDELWFVATNLEYGQELWRVNQATGDAELFQDLYAGPNGSTVTNLFAIEDWLYFTASTDGQSYWLWRTDGTSGGTQQLVPLISTTLNNPSPTLVWGSGNSIFVSLKGQTSTSELYHIDATSFTSELIHSNYPNYPISFIMLNDKFYFNGESSVAGREIWVTDGTASGTNMLFDVWPGAEGSYPEEFTIYNGFLYFSARNMDGKNLYRTDGTSAGTIMVDNVPNSIWGYAMPTVWNGQLWYLRNNASELWRTDGNTLEFMQDGLGFNDVQGIFPTPTALYFVTHMGSDRGVWKYDGLPNNGFNPVKGSFTADGWSMASPFIQMQGNTYFWAEDSTSERLIWRTDGPSTETFPITSPPQLYYDTNDNMPFVISDSLLIFTKKTAQSGRELWRSTGELASEQLILDLVPGADNGVSTIYGSDGQYVYFNANGSKLYRTDGSENGTILLIDGIGSFGGWVRFDGKLFGTCHYQGETWILRTDGTPTGTELFIKTANVQSFGLVKMVVFNSKLYFNKEGNDGVWSIWESDGTVVGTQIAITGNNLTNFDFFELTTTGSNLYFIAANSQNEPYLYVSDGTAAGTQPLIDFGQLSQEMTSFYATLKPIGDKVIFNRSDNTYGSELWITDGTVSGTFLLKDIALGPVSSLPMLSKGVDSDSLFYFNAFTEEHGAELWRTDGTPDGTLMLQDICPGNCSAYPDQLSATPDGRIFFTANSPENGVEPWVYYPEGISATRPDYKLPQLESFLIFPNPTKESIKIERVDKQILEGIIQVFDGAGRQVLEYNMESGIRQFTLPLPHLVSGIYFLLMKDNTGKLLGTKQFITQ